MTNGPASTEERDPDFKKRLCARDRAALGRFYELFFDRIYGYVRRMLGEDHLAEDVTQEVFVHIQRSIATYDPERDLSPWVFAIATNKVRDHWRSRRHHDALRELSFEGEDGAKRNEPADGRRGPLRELEGVEMRETLDAAIDALPAGMRETLVLRWFEEMSFEDIGRIIERNETAARKRYSRALEELRNTLERDVDASRDGAT
jgi:RNA polymerase sigma-70 factor (ECF subfamily)